MTNRASSLVPILIGLLFAGGSAAAEEVGDVHQGKLVYERYCVSCHGDKGNGQGEFAEWISPVSGKFRMAVLMTGKTLPFRNQATDATPSNATMISICAAA